LNAKYRYGSSLPAKPTAVRSQRIAGSANPTLGAAARFVLTEHGMETSFDRVYAQFANMYADSKPVRWQQELDAAIRAAGLTYADVTREWLLALDPAWVYRESDAPFRDLARNLAYRRFLEG
jgi:hypothetical protein